MLLVHSKVIHVLYIYTYIIFEIMFHYRLLQDIDSRSLCYTVNLCCLLHSCFFLIRNLAFYYTKSNKYKQNVINCVSQANICKFSEIYILFILFTYMYTEAFLLCLIKACKRTLKKRDGEIGNKFLKSRCISELSRNFLNITIIQVRLFFSKAPDMFLMSSHV